MIFLFLLINISFSLFFLLFWYIIESIIFWVLTIIFFIYFNSFITLFGKEKKRDYIEKKFTVFSLKKTIQYLKKGSYYLSFLLFYCSLYGIVYGLNLIYHFSDFSSLFHNVALFITLSITIIYLFFFSKKQETIFLIFRSNCIIFSGIYTIFLIYLLFYKETITTSFIINSIFPLFTLLSVSIFDEFFSKKNTYTYSFFLFYLLLFVIFYCSIFFPALPLVNIFLYVGIFFAYSYFNIFPRLLIFRPFGPLLQYIGMIIGNTVLFILLIIIYFQPLNFSYIFLLGITCIFQYFLHKKSKNYISYSLSLFSFIFLYVKIFFLYNTFAFFTYFLFVFILPVAFIGGSYFFRMKYQWDVYILHYAWIIFSFIYIGYYFIFIENISILSFSSVVFLESLILFMSYVRLKK